MMMMLPAMKDSQEVDSIRSNDNDDDDDPIISEVTVM